jgi:hypothetical protein
MSAATTYDPERGAARIATLVRGLTPGAATADRAAATLRVHELISELRAADDAGKLPALQLGLKRRGLA